MNGRQQPPHRSSSMAYIDDEQLEFNKYEAQRWGRALESSQHALNQSIDSPAYRGFRSNTASAWRSPGSREIQVEYSSRVSGGTGGNAVQSPSSDTTVKLGNGTKERSGTHIRSPGSNIAAATPETRVVQSFGAPTLSTSSSPRHQSFAGTAVDSPLQPHFGDAIPTRAKQAREDLSLGWTPSAPMQEQKPWDSVGLQPKSNKATFGDTSRGQPAFAVPQETPEDLHARRGPNLHQRRLSARMPGAQSPLGLSRMREQLHEDDDGGVPLFSRSNGRVGRGYKMEFDGNKGCKMHMKEDWQSNPASKSPTVQRYASSGPINSPMFDVFPRSAVIDSEGNLTLGKPGYTSGSGHARKHTDPFVDDGSVRYRVPSVNTRMCGVTEPFHLPNKSHMGGTSTPSQLSPHTFVRPSRTPSTASWPTSAPATSGFTLPPVVAGPRSAREPGAQDRPPLRSNLPIPPPPLSCIQGHYQHTAEARARLDAQKPVREAWIRDEAAKIAQLAKLRHATEKQYQETHSKEDYDVWQEIEAAYADATNLEKRQEERRNLLLQEKRMKALKTDNTKDMSAASRDKVGADGEEKLLGFKMALMERECAEVKSDDEEEAITMEMLATLSLEERKALRKHLVMRLERKS